MVGTQVNLNNQRKFGPKTSTHPSIGELCPVCRVPFKEGDYTTLVVIGIDDPIERTNAKLGKPYNAKALEIHWECSEGGNSRKC